MGRINVTPSIFAGASAPNRQMRPRNRAMRQRGGLSHDGRSRRSRHSFRSHYECSRVSFSARRLFCLVRDLGLRIAQKSELLRHALEENKIHER